jgi:hypothetical protein
LIEFIVNKKSKIMVICFIIKKIEDNIIIWIIYNKSFLDIDKFIFDKLEKLLDSLSYNRNIFYITNFQLYTQFIFLI